MADLAFAAARAGDFDRAEAFARTITSGYDQNRAMADLAFAAARAGDFDRAEDLARTIDPIDMQARVLADLATIVAQAGDFDRARRILALVLVMDLSGTWWIDRVLQLFPSDAGSAWDVLVGAYAPQI
jgi:Flp pilus assembly protein TadD